MAPKLLTFISDVIQTYTLSGVASAFFTPTDNAKYITIDPRKFSNDIGQYAEICVKITDVTQMFGSGNEPATVDEFYACIPEGVDINAYNPGEIISMNANAIETNGLNQWDEEWAISENRICSKNLISVLPNTDYYVKGSFANGIFWYDENKQKISTIYPTNAIVKSPATARYMKFYLGASYGTTYKNDICINLSHTGVRNGEYEPYWKSVKDLSVIKKYFPNGMRSAGSAYDEIVFDESKQKWVAIQRIGEVDLGTYTWFRQETSSECYSFYCSVTGFASQESTVLSNLTCLKYTASTWHNAYYANVDKIIANTERYIRIVDNTYTDADTFKADLNGVKLYYELAEPIVTEIDEIVDFSYKVGDFGIEMILTDSSSTAFRGDIVYGFNAVDRIRDNSRNIEKLKKRLNNGVKPNIAGGSSLVSISYGELVNLRDNNGLIPGTWYRITDYITTTYQENTSSAGHPFDVIVLALSENTLSEEAYAIKSERDTDNYFGTSNLSAWKIKYTLDNNTNRFEWADEENGKGVIYRMIDEYNNDCPYDFKSIMFRNPNNTTDTNYYYTFYYRQSGKIYDATTHSNTKDRCYNNIIKCYKIDKKLYISNNSFRILSSNTGCYNNTFGNNCYNNTFGDGCSNNTFGNNCYNNVFGNGCYNNTFGNNCQNITFGNYCSDNTFGNNCHDNSFVYVNSSDSTKTGTLNGIVNCDFSNEYQYNELKHLRNLNTDTTYYLRNVHFCKGVKGNANQNNTIIIEGTLPDNIETKVATNSKGELKIYCEADLIP